MQRAVCIVVLCALSLQYVFLSLSVRLGMVSHVSWVLSWICGHKDEEENSALHHESQQVPCMSVPDPLPRAEKRQDHRLCWQRVRSERICHPPEQVIPHICFVVKLNSHLQIFSGLWVFFTLICFISLEYFFSWKVFENQKKDSLIYAQIHFWLKHLVDYC